MKFRHSLTVLIDNFSLTYKQLVYKLVIALITAGLTVAIVYPFLNALTSLEEFKNLLESIKTFFNNLLEGKLDADLKISEKIKAAIESIGTLIEENSGVIALGITGLIFVRLVNMFFSSIGNYAAAAVINDKMALRAQSPFLITLIKNLKNACLYSLMYVPLSFLYDAICVIAMYFFIFKALTIVPMLIQIFMFLTAIVFLITLKLTLASDWLPALIRGRKKRDKGNSFQRTNICLRP